MQKLTQYKPNKDQETEWYLVDATNVRLGKLSSEIAKKLLAKDDVSKVDYMASKRKIIVLNSDQVSVHPKKLENKKYYTHSGYIGHLKTKTLKTQLEDDSRKVIRHSVSGMLPKNKLQDKYLANLYIYKGENHEHEAHKPTVFNIE